MSMTLSREVETRNYFWNEKSSDVIGRGSFGQVFKARDKETGEFVAVKVSERGDDRTYQKEVEVLRSLDSPYIIKFITQQPVRLYDGLQVLGGTGRSAIVMELAKSNLRDEMNKPENRFGIPLDMLIRLIDNLEKGLSYLHQKKVAHRDVKPANILICDSDSVNGETFKLCDFGGARYVFSETQPLNTICGTPGYLNEFTTANLARRSNAYTYTKDECDLWSVGCTIYEAATGRLPFIPSRGAAEHDEMYNMMLKRPPNVISGYADRSGRYVWSTKLPSEQCFYPESFKRVLSEFLRRLFDNHASTRLTFTKFSAYCKELVRLRRFKLLCPNTATIEDYFDTSNVVQFERFAYYILLVYFDDDMKERFLLSKDVILCIFALPSGTAEAKLTPLVRDLIQQSTQVVIMTLKVSTKPKQFGKEPSIQLDMPKTVPESPITSHAGPSNGSSSYIAFLEASANILLTEKQTSELKEFNASIRSFCHEFCKKLVELNGNLSREVNWAIEYSSAVAIQSSALSLLSHTADERKNIENNIKVACIELTNSKNSVNRIDQHLNELGNEVRALDSIEILKHPSQREKLFTLIRNRRITMGVNRQDVSVERLLDADRRFLLKSLDGAVNLYEKTAYFTTDLLTNHIEIILRKLFDECRDLNRAKNSLKESLQLVHVAQETNERRVEASSSSDSNNSSIMDVHVSTALQCAKNDAVQRKRKAEQEYRETERLIESLSRIQNTEANQQGAGDDHYQSRF
ncbi:unnamed protein product [Anisakis simplex]|uniref:IkappaB kinase n=1 Tax=Anisakis simplex TaxID=6269 RepID=A0A0M3JYI1_ANISI|nr:unnamed protein product [Anisakis simplex]